MRAKGSSIDLCILLLLAHLSGEDRGMGHWRRPRSVAQRGGGQICLVLFFFLFRGKENEHDTPKEEDEDEGLFFFSFFPVLCSVVESREGGWDGDVQMRALVRQTISRLLSLSLLLIRLRLDTNARSPAASGSFCVCV